MFAAMNGEFVTSVSARGGAAMIASASACAVDDASRKIVAPSSTRVSACAAIAALASGSCAIRAVPGRRVGRGRVERARAAADAHDQALARELLEIAVRGHARDGMGPREIGDRRRAALPDVLQDAGAAHRRRDRAHMFARSVLTDSSTSHE